LSVFQLLLLLFLPDVFSLPCLFMLFLVVTFRCQIMVSGSLRLGRNTAVVVAVVVVVVVVEEAFRSRSRVLLLNDLVHPRFNPLGLHVMVVGRHES
jgi:hypothetical protein